MNSQSKSHVGCVYQVLILLVDHLIKNLREACSSIKNLSHHYNMLADYNNSIELIRDQWKMLLIILRAFLINNEYCEPVIIAIHQDGLRNFNSDELRNFSHFLSFKIYLLNYLVMIILVKVTNVEGLLSEDFISELRKTLSQTELGYLAMFMVEFVSDLVRTLCAKPLISPLFKVQVTLRMMLVIACLQ